MGVGRLGGVGGSEVGWGVDESDVGDPGSSGKDIGRGETIQ